MSRVAKKPIELVKNVSAKINKNEIVISGSKGNETLKLHRLVVIKQDDNNLLVEPADSSTEANAMAGTTRAIVQNMVQGVNAGFEKKLTLVGVGYKAQLQGKKLNLSLGFSHAVVFDIPEGITIETPSQTEVIVKGTDKQAVGQVAANIRGYRPPEPYKGKGVRYTGEKIIFKETKKK